MIKIFHFGNHAKCFFIDLKNRKISDTDMELFTLVDSEGDKITEGEQLGLLLYRGGKVCNDRYYYSSYFTYTAADAICKEMNFARAKRWTDYREWFDISSNYEIILHSVVCGSTEWDKCSYHEKPRSCQNYRGVYLSCTGK